MKSMRKLLVLMVAVVLLVIPSIASAYQIIYTLCQWYDVEKNCYHCSDYFSVRSEEEAQRKCRGATPYYFPSVGALHSWMLGNCTCDKEE